MTFDPSARVRRVLEQLKTLISLTTKIVDHPGQSVNAGVWFTMIDEAGKGMMGAFHARSPDVDFEIKLTVDGTVVLEKTYAELREIQQNSPTISAFAERDENGDLTGYYVASVRDAPYYVSIKLEIQNTGGAPKTFSQLFTKYHPRE